MGVNPDVVHELNVNPNAQPKKQKRRLQSQEKQEAANKEVDRLTQVDFIKEVLYPE